MALPVCAKRANVAALNPKNVKSKPRQNEIAKNVPAN